MNHLDFILDTKAVTEDGQIEGLAAGYGNIDAGGDVIVPGALFDVVVGQGKPPAKHFHCRQRLVAIDGVEDEQGVEGQAHGGPLSPREIWNGGLS